jgi:nicotinamidase-related amidase
LSQTSQVGGDPADDRLRCRAAASGFDCLVLEDCVGSYFPEFQEMGLKMIKAQGGIFGWVGRSEAIIATLSGAR